MQVDRIDVTREAVVDEKVHDAATELLRAVGGAEDGHRARVQDAVDADAWRGARATQRGVQSGCAHATTAGLT